MREKKWWKKQMSMEEKREWRGFPLPTFIISQNALHSHTQNTNIPRSL